MLTTINNYKVKRLLLNGHYICSSASDSNLTYLLCATKNKNKRSLRNYKLLHIDNLLFPTEITIIEEGDTYDCFFLPDNLSLCMIKLQSRSFSSTHLVMMFQAFCKGLPEILEHDVLKKQLLTCLCWDNMWMFNHQLILVWHPDKKQTIQYNQQTLIEKLIEILKMMHLTINTKNRDNTFLKSIVGFLKSDSSKTKTLKQLNDYLAQICPIKPVPNLKSNQYSPIKMKKMQFKNNRYSIDYTQNSVQKSLRFIKSYRKKTIDITQLKKKNKMGKFSLFQNMKRNNSPPNHSKSKQRSFSKDLTNYKMAQFSENDTIRTQSGNLRISNLLRSKAIQAFQIQKKHSIDATRLTPDKTRLITASKTKNNSTWRQISHQKDHKLKPKYNNLHYQRLQEYTIQYNSLHSEKQQIPQDLSQKNQLTNTFKMKMLRFQKKKEGDDKIMRLFSSNRQQKKMNLHVELPQRVSTMIDKIQHRNPLTIHRSQIKLTQNEISYTSHDDDRKNWTIDKMPSSKRQEKQKQFFKRLSDQQSNKIDSMPLPLQRNIFDNQHMKEYKSEIEGSSSLNNDIKSNNSKEPSDLRELMNRLINAPVIIRTVNSEVQIKQQKIEIPNDKKQPQQNKKKQHQKNQLKIQEYIKPELKIKQKSVLKSKKQINPSMQTQQPKSKSIKSVRIQQSLQLEKQMQFVPASNPTIKIKNSKQLPIPSRPFQSSKNNMFQQDDIQEIVLDNKSKKKNQSKVIENKNNTLKTTNNTSQIQKKVPIQKQLTKNKLQLSIKQNKTDTQVINKNIIKQQKRQKVLQQQKMESNKKQNIVQSKQQNISTKQKEKTQVSEIIQSVKQSTKPKEKKKTSQLKRTTSMQVKLEDDKKSTKTEKSIDKSTIQSQIQQYIHYINLIGQAVSKSQKVCKKFVDIQWFTGIYFLYKRFLRQRKKIQQWLEDGIRNFKRPSQQQLNKDSFEKWLSSDSRNNLLKKIKSLNNDITQSIGKMYKSLTKKCINSKVLSAGQLQKNDPHQSNIMMQFILVQFDDLLQKQMTDEIRQHLVQILDAAFIVAELDGKNLPYLVNIKQRKLMRDIQQYFEYQQKVVDDLAKAYNIQ